ncbi:hypothetical protein M441DRAFT_79849 [Trichoderma asperellum CBS 433.97]|uniref:Uncharacterized protein n=1 Tax=Trichoderma asperellum (strain ATCC 204424 / CBS 433.97 / NBRC 101777) TaxID=1042311 RepID=A0A2T3ZAC4_TRIA4|nr:hypothetical protein M441DRAFT_79849 [Trichoderma asperellum CBS 433.97]PTB41757.1 hypothetical protein M441DRAFT_79849 [Trichoderma asperellum CBS 433.97]
MNKNSRQASPPVDVPASEPNPYYDAPPVIPNNESTTPAARTRNAFVGALHAFGQDKNSPIYISIVAPSLAYFFCKVSGGSNCGSLGLCVTTFLSIVHFAATNYAAASCDNINQHIGNDSFILLSLSLCSFCYFCIRYFHSEYVVSTDACKISTK